MMKLLSAAGLCAVLLTSTSVGAEAVKPTAPAKRYTTQDRAVAAQPMPAAYAPEQARAVLIAALLMSAAPHVGH